jgi:hypothetical protein
LKEIVRGNLQGLDQRVLYSLGVMTEALLVVATFEPWILAIDT